MSTYHYHDDHHDDFGGLHRDLAATRQAIGRRGWLRLAAGFGVGLGALPVLACGEDSPTAPSRNTGGTTGTGGTSGTGTTGGGSASGACARIPEETQGPYPADGSNGPTVLTQSGVVRTDIRSSFAGLSGAATGVPLTIQLTIVSAASCEPLAGRAVYLWQCDALGRYSLYSSGVTNQNYLRGVQEADASGRLTFVWIFPGCYMGRWPHIHFEVYPSLAAATNVRSKMATSQIALPKDVSDLVYAEAGYTGSAANLSRVSLASDMVFNHGSALELATVMGSVSGGYTAMLTVAV